MRSAPWLCLSVVCLAAGLQASPVHARAVHTNAARRQVLKQDFVGYGLTVRDAEQHARVVKVADLQRGVGPAE